MNSVCLVGRMTKDPELRRTQSGKACTTFTVAVNRTYNKNEADFIKVVAWGNTAESVCNYCYKGFRVGVHGRLETSSYVDKEGRNVQTVQVTADNVEFLEAKKQEDYGITDADIEF